jgi:predicted nucleotidyltransferase
MDLTSPIRSVVPSAHGDVLAVLARSGQPLTGRGVAALTGGQRSVKGVNLALRRLVAAGIVLVEDHPPAKLYRLNRRHLAADAIVALADLRPRLIEAMCAALAGWDRPPAGAWLFGSAARGDGGVGSDIDVLLVRTDDIDTEDPQWSAQVELFSEDVLAWSGNRCAVVEYSDAEFSRLMAGDERLARDLRNDGIRLTARRLAPRRAGTAP